MATIRWTALESPIGTLLLVGDDAGLRSIRFPREHRGAAPDRAWVRDDRALAPAARQLRDYFAGRRASFELTLAPRGTEFQLRVWSELEKIPYGVTISYGELARRVGNPRASRAVGLANGSNPLPIVIPCHRVIGSDGRLTGYGGGLAIKERLLGLERGELALV